jgi:pyrroloquinoline quinone (PQQ) biosynthesis protein C
MEKPRIRHIAINVADREKCAEYYKATFQMEEKYRGPSGTIYLSDGHMDVALISTDKYPWGIHHFGFKVDSVGEIEKIANTKAEENTFGAVAESWIQRRRRQPGRCLRAWLAGLKNFGLRVSGCQASAVLRWIKYFEDCAVNRNEWRYELGEVVRDAMRSPELDHYFKVKITKPGAQVLITQLGLFIHHRRDCWSHVSGNCPHMSVKQKILQHEYGEVIKDNYTEHGHMELIVRQGKALDLTPEQVMNVEPLPSTMATLYAWAWMTREKSWLEGLASLTITEWANDDRLLQDVGGGLSSRMAKRWMNDLGFGWEQMPNFKVHSEADEEHSDMFLEDLEKFATGEKETQVYQAAKESMDLLKIFRGGIAKEMEKFA